MTDAPAPSTARVRRKVDLEASSHYDAAATTAHNAKHWAHANGGGAASTGDQTSRMILRNRARYEVANNAYAKRMMLTLANDTIGTGPTMFLQGFSNRDASRKVKKAYSLWSRQINLPEKLRAMKMARTIDGEIFAVLTNNPGLRGPIKLDLKLVEADRIRGFPSGMQAVDDELHSEGIVYDAYDNPVTYYIDQQHPGDHFAGLSQPVAYPASQVIHWFRRDRPGQRRGVSEMAPCLELFAQLRRYTLAVLGAAETAADFAAVVFSNMPADAAGPDDIAPLDVVELEARAAVTLPYGWQLGQIKAEQPTTSYAEFKSQILTEAGGAFCMPRNVATGDSSDYNFASGRLDFQPYHASIGVSRDDCEAEVMSRIVESWFDEASLIEGLLPQEARGVGASDCCGFRWPGFVHVDPDKVSRANERDLSNGIAGLPGLHDAAGLDWEEEQERNAEAVGLTVDEYRERLVEKLFGPTAAPAPEGQEPEEAEQEEPQDAA